METAGLLIVRLHVRADACTSSPSPPLSSHNLLITPHLRLMPFPRYNKSPFCVRKTFKNHSLAMRSSHDYFAICVMLVAAGLEIS